MPDSLLCSPSSLHCTFLQLCQYLGLYQRCCTSARQARSSSCRANLHAGSWQSLRPTKSLRGHHSSQALRTTQRGAFFPAPTCCLSHTCLITCNCKRQLDLREAHLALMLCAGDAMLTSPTSPSLCTCKWSPRFDATAAAIHRVGQFIMFKSALPAENCGVLKNSF